MFPVSEAASSLINAAICRHSCQRVMPSVHLQSFSGLKLTEWIFVFMFSSLLMSPQISLLSPLQNAHCSFAFHADTIIRGVFG